MIPRSTRYQDRSRDDSSRVRQVAKKRSGRDTFLFIPFLSPFSFLAFFSRGLTEAHDITPVIQDEIEVCAIATKHCRDGDDDVPGMSGFGTANRRGRVSGGLGRKWGKLTKIRRKRRKQHSA